MTVLSWWSHLSGSCRLCVRSEREREKEKERKRKRKRKEEKETREEKRGDEREKIMKKTD